MENNNGKVTAYISGDHDVVVRINTSGAHLCGAAWDILRDELNNYEEKYKCDKWDSVLRANKIAKHFTLLNGKYKSHVGGYISFGERVLGQDSSCLPTEDDSDFEFVYRQVEYDDTTEPVKIELWET